MNFEIFQTEAQFVRQKGCRRLMVQHGHCLYCFSQQRNGKLTMQPADVLRDIYTEQIEPQLTGPNFFEQLQAHMAALGTLKTATA